VTDPTPHLPTDPAVAVALAELRGTVETGFATVNGSLALLAQRTDQTDKTLDEHGTRLAALERNRWPLPAVAAVTGLGSLAVTVWQSTH
jgi:cytolysin (calcineurin-like family phosphatase)